MEKEAVLGWRRRKRLEFRVWGIFG